MNMTSYPVLDIDLDVIRENASGRHLSCADKIIINNSCI